VEDSSAISDTTCVPDTTTVTGTSATTTTKTTTTKTTTKTTTTTPIQIVGEGQAQSGFGALDTSDYALYGCLGFVVILTAVLIGQRACRKSPSSSQSGTMGAAAGEKGPTIVTNDDWTFAVSVAPPPGLGFGGSPEGGIFITKVKEGGNGALTGQIQVGHQIVAISGTPVAGLDKKECVVLMKAAGNPILFEFAENPAGYARFAQSHSDATLKKAKVDVPSEVEKGQTNALSALARGTAAEPDRYAIQSTEL
jgi:hypothetical protein